MATLGRNGITSKYQQDIPTNNNEEVSAEDVRGVLRDFNDSKFNLVDDDLRGVKDASTEIAGDFGNTYNKLLYLIGETGTRKLFYVDSSRVDSGRTRQTNEPNATITSNSGFSASISNSNPYSSDNRITINFTNNTGFEITNVRAETKRTDRNWIYTITDLQITNSSVTFILDRNDFSNGVGAVRFSFFGEIKLDNNEWVAEI